jgi:hypothetical protein
MASLVFGQFRLVHSGFFPRPARKELNVPKVKSKLRAK